MAGTGADTLIGGLGNDTYIVDNVGDVIIENANQGSKDLVQSSITYVLGDNVENLTLTGSDAINATGNDLNNVLTGNSANNILDAGLGANTLIGGLGDDTYVVHNRFFEFVKENANEGTDLVLTTGDYVLDDNIENLTLMGSDAIYATGNDLNNVLTGNSANNILDAGLGADTMLGGLGSDTYIVDNADDVVIENSSEGTDTVQSSIAYTLGNNIENLTLTENNTINGTGNALDNVITGNTANNVLDGGLGADTLAGGTGNDTLNGGAGSDAYHFNLGDGADVISDDNNAGADTNKLVLGEGITTSDLAVSQDGNDLIITINNTTDCVRVKDWFCRTAV